MTFPVIRPGDAAHLPWRTRELLLVALDSECRAAASRHRQILAARSERRALATLPDPDDVARARRDVHGPVYLLALVGKPRSEMDSLTLAAVRRADAARQRARRAAS